MKKCVIILITLLLIIIVALYVKYNNLQNRYETSVENIKAYDNILSSSKEEERVLKLTVEQLNYFNDSLLKEMNNVRKELGIKDKDIQQLQYKLSNVGKSDTITLKDTIFKDKSFELDTIIGDKWYSNRLYLKYPNIISSSPEFTLESFVVISGKKELINPPKKNKIARFFQNIFGRKHTVVEVSTKENNPYVKNKSQRYIQIIK